MSRRGLRSKAITLCAVALGLTAVSSSGAQASWMLNGADLTSGLLPSIDITEIEGGSGSFLTKIAGAQVRYTCTGVQLIGAKLELEGKVTSGLKAKYTGCETFLNGVLSAICVPKSAGLANGEIETQALKGSFGGGLLTVTPSAGENIKVLKHGAECSLPESIPVKGNIVFKDGKGEAKAELISHLLTPDPSTTMFVISNTPEHVVSLDGSVVAALAGAHEGMQWSGL